MAYWTETDDNNKITNVQAVFGDVFIDIGQIEKPYSHDNTCMATGSNHETLRNGDSFIFTDFQEAYNAIVEAFERSCDSNWTLDDELAEKILSTDVTKIIETTIINDIKLSKDERIENATRILDSRK
jgi:hypothetical protein